MREPIVREVANWVRDQLQVPFVVVGGSAIEHKVPVGTNDVDLLIAVGSWRRLDVVLEGRRDATPLNASSGTIRGTVVTVGSARVDVEFISGEPFSGPKGADDFVEYVRAYRSTLSDGVRYADPAVVFYMRLSTDDWQAYVPSILRDLRAGVPGETLVVTVKVAAHFGVREKISERVEFVRKTIRLFEPRHH